MDTYERIWNLSKMRFLQSEARLWLIGNKALEIIMLIGVGLWAYFEIFYTGGFEFLKFIGLIFIFYSIGEIRSRFGMYEGYFDGYERGFSDAASGHCDYWGETHSETSDNSSIKRVLKSIKRSEKQMSEENMEARTKEVEEGFSKLLGYSLTWRKMKGTN